jgi:uracil-DNA glycosylase family 4
VGIARLALETELALKNLKFVGTRGNLGAPICFVGEAPGVDEDSAGKPFVGPSGRLLDTMIFEGGLDASACWFTNPIKTRPPDNKLSRLGELGIGRQVFLDEFFEELNDTKPTFIVACGATPLNILCPATASKSDDETKIGKWRGSLLTSPKLGWPHYIFPIFHPAFILRTWDEKYFNTFLLQKLAQEHSFWKTNGRLDPLPVRSILHSPTFDEAFEYLQKCLTSPDIISVDIELLRRRYPYTISFALSSSSAISIAFADYTEDQASVIWRLMGRVLASKKVLGQNYTNFDMYWLGALGLQPNINLVEDTRIRHAVLWPELSHKLDFMTIQYTREPYYKEEGKGWSKIRGGEGLRQLKTYNCKDTLVTREIYDVQELEFQDKPELRTFYDKHELPLAKAMWLMEHRGMLCDEVKMQELRSYIKKEQSEACARSEKLVGKTIVINAAQQKLLGATPSVNIGSPTQLIECLQARNIKIPKTRFGKETTSEEKLHELYANTGDEFLKEILRIRELNKIEGTYVDCIRPGNVLYSTYVVGGTVTGRRSAKAICLGYGLNHQNIPKHSPLGKKYRACIIARPGMILINCDQVSAEDWIVQGIIADVSGDDNGVQELISGVDRHQKLAARIFGLPLEECSKDAEKAGKIYRYVGKRTRHASHYDMQGPKLSAVFAKEGFSIPTTNCNMILEQFHKIEPSIKGVFHEYIKKEITDHRRLTNLFGRQRDFFGFCPWRDNQQVFRDAYSYIPQGTVGDNTGEALLTCESKGISFILSEAHDALLLEVEDDARTVVFAVRLLQKAFHRTLRFARGYALEIPVEFDIGYNMKDMRACGDLSTTGLQNTLVTLRQQVKHPQIIYSGQQQPLSPHA